MESPAYVVFNGRLRGIFYTWEECERQVWRYKRARYKKYPSLQEALDAWRACTAPASNRKSTKESDSSRIMVTGTSCQFPLSDSLRDFLGGEGLLP